MRKLLATLALTMLGATAAPTAAPVTRLSVGDALPRAGMLRPGVHRYVRYSVKGEKRELADIWVREVRLIRRDGVQRIQILQRWDRGAAPACVRRQDSVVEAGTFRPITHSSRVEREGQGTISAYRFEQDRIVGDGTVENNSKAKFVQPSKEPAFNFETDIEQLQMLPWRAGYSVSIPFYDPGLEPPARYVFRTEGSQRLIGPGGTAIDCWVVTSDYNTGAVVKRFWFAKRSNVMIHEEARQGDVLYVKTLLGSESGTPTPLPALTQRSR